LRLRYLPVALVAILTSLIYWIWSRPEDRSGEQRIVQVALSPSKHWIAAAAASGWVGVWERSAPERMQRFRAGPVRRLGFSADGEWLVLDNGHWLRHPVRHAGVLEEAEPADAHAAPAAGGAEIPGPEPGTVLKGNQAGSVEIRNTQTGALLERYTFR
jgi:hypothetical protein